MYSWKSGVSAIKTNATALEGIEAHDFNSLVNNNTKTPVFRPTHDVSTDPTAKKTGGVVTHNTRNSSIDLQPNELSLVRLELSRERERYADLYQHAPTGYLTVNSQHHILDANHVAEKLLERPFESLVGEHMRDIINVEDQYLFHQHWHEIPENGKRINCQLRVCCNGITRWVEMASRKIQGGLCTLPHVHIAISDCTDQKAAKQTPASQATPDPLTGLITRTQFEYCLQQLINPPRQTEAPLDGGPAYATNGPGEERALCYIDVDHFKVIQDTCGHRAGDTLIKQLTTLIQRNTSSKNIIATLGGDVFVVLLNDCSLAKASRHADRLHTSIAHHRFCHAGKIHRINASIGVVAADLEKTNVQDLLIAADNACYVAKRRGGNRIHVYQDDDSIIQARKNEMQWVARISKALDENRFALWAQPIAPIIDSGGSHFELLLKMIDEDGSIISAAEFFTAANRYGLSTQLDYWVVNTAVEYLVNCKDNTSLPGMCFIRLSGSSLTDEDFLNFVVHLISSSPTISTKLCFEISETVATHNTTTANEFMRTIGHLGCRFALGDFGCGMSSFAYLKTLSADYLKIDGSLVKDILQNDVNLALVRSINEIAKVLGKKTIAEFVENNAIHNKLSELGVDYVQGNGIGKPEPLIPRLLNLEVAA